VRDVHQAHEGERWPSARWQKDPVGFARTILGVKLWSFQVEFLEAIRDNRHVAVSGGRKIGKDFAVAVAALWWFASFENSRVFYLAPTSKQLDGIAYRETRMLFAGSGRCLDCKRAGLEVRPCPHSAVLTGKMGLLARNGIKEGFREIVGMTSVNQGGLRGMSGARILAIEDEASDIKDEFDTALVGNLAGSDCVRVLISNPCKSWGFFHRAFHEERDLFKTMTVSTEENPNVIAGRNVYPGLADRQWLKEREVAWGRDSMLWIANVEGRFPKAEEGQLFTLESVTLASSAEHYEAAIAEGRLQLGVDVAGESGEGDESAFCIRRGMKQLEPIHAAKGLSPDLILETARATLARHRRPGDVGDDMKPILVVDRDGAEGAKAWDRFDAYSKRDDSTRAEFRLIGFQGGNLPTHWKDRTPYRWYRDVGFAGLLDWFKNGGAILPDLKLEAEIICLRWAAMVGGKSQLEPKSIIKDRIRRSPDRLDALMLSVFLPIGFHQGAMMPEIARTGYAGYAPPYARQRSDDGGRPRTLGSLYGVNRRGPR
jgi:hypothetical protein